MQNNNTNTSFSAADHSIGSSFSAADHSIISHVSGASFPKASPLVSICCITYNHAPFIRQCLDGFLMQQPPISIINSSLSKANQSIIQASWLEILIHDDCSTDGTTEIIKEYAAKYPDIIFPLYEEENQFSKPGRESMDFYNYRRARGKYIAYCEGDDYWTDPLKLQKQVDFMESHPDYTICFHEYVQYDVNTKQSYWPKYPCDGDFDITQDVFLCNEYCSQPLTMIFRISSFSFEWHKHYRRYLDTIEIYHLLCVGKGRFLRFVGGQYNMHTSGISSQMSRFDRANLTLSTHIDMYKYIKDSFLRKKVRDNALWTLLVYDEEKRQKEKWHVWKELFHVPFIMLEVLGIRVKRNLKVWSRII